MAVTYNIKGTSNPSFKIGKKGVVLSPADNTSETTLTIPNATGTAALLESTQTFSGAITFDASGNSVIVSDTLRIAQSGSGLRMTNVGAFDNDGSDNFRIFGTNSLYLRANGENGGGLSIDSANQDVTVDNDLIVSGNLTVQGTTTTVDSTTVNIQNAFVFEGATADAFETTLTVTDPTADRTITLPDATGTVALTSDLYTNSDVDAHLNQSNPTSGYVLSWNGSDYAWVEQSGGVQLDGTTEITGTITPGTNNTYALGSSSKKFSAVYSTSFEGTATSAQYADLAEMYAGDQAYEPGTVVVVGGTHEVTQCTKHLDSSLAGVVSEKPGYLMNKDIDAEYPVCVGFVGRVPVKVIGHIEKGDLLTTSSIPGFATKYSKGSYEPGCIIGVALTNKNEIGEGTVEVLLKRS